MQLAPVVLATGLVPACVASQPRAESRAPSVVLPRPSTSPPVAPTPTAPAREPAPAPAPSKVASEQADPSAGEPEVLAVCERYRQAVEARDVDVLLALASPQYLEDGDNDDPSDDLDYAGLRAYLRGPFQDIRDVSYDIDYESVRWEGDTAVVEYRYRSFYRFGDIERRTVGTSRLELRREAGVLKIVSGI